MDNKEFDPTKMTPPMADISWVKRRFLDIPYGGSKAQALDIYLPHEGDGPFPLVVHIHGGGFAFGDKRDEHMDAYLGGIKLGFAVASVEYRLSSEAIFPAAVLDCREAVRFLKENAKLFCLDPDRIGLIGGSAGANLCAMLAMNVPNGEFPGEDIREIRPSQPFVRTAVCHFGPMSFASMEEQARQNGISATHPNSADMPESAYIGTPIADAPSEVVAAANPATYAGPAMCPILVQHGTQDHLVPFEQAGEFVAAVTSRTGSDKVTYVPLEGADHDDKMFTDEPNMSFVWKYLKDHLE
ncbi:MAG: alpha/beta hydrolase [Lachnospiraceae bacterium]|nr:alpha/beta hydrolase [Lachnospiraceae bacterium]